MKNLIKYLAVSAAVALLPSPARAELALQVHDGHLNVPLVFYGTYGMVTEGRIGPASSPIESAFDYNSFFTKVQKVKPGGKPISAVRVWLHYHFGNALDPFAGLPKTAHDTDRRHRYDFTFNEAFFTRLEQFVAAADRHNIAVQLCLFDGVALESGSLRWSNNPYNRANNRDPHALTRPADFFRTSGAVWDVNRSLIQHTVQKIGQYPNIIWEIMNEPGASQTGATPAAVVDFHEAIYRALREDFQFTTGSKLISVNADSPELRAWVRKPEVSVDVLSFHLAWSADVSRVDFKSYLSEKPVIISNDGHRSCDERTPLATRRKDAASLVRRVFAADGPGNEGRLHVEFLDNVLVAGHNSKDYDPRATRVPATLLETLQKR